MFFFCELNVENYVENVNYQGRLNLSLIHIYYLVEDGILKESTPHALNMIPIFEYPANNARLGSFEIGVLRCFFYLNQPDLWL